MTISSSVRLAGPYTGTGSVSTYPFAFKVFQSSDVLVKQTDLSGNITTLVLTTDYSVSLSSDQNANPGGSVNLNSPLPNGYQLVISSQVTETQGTSLTNNGGFYPSVIENALDYLTILVQQMQTVLSNALQLPITVTGVSTTLPTPQSGQLIGWNAAGTALVNTSPTGVGAGTITGGAAGAGGNIAADTITDVNVAPAAAISSAKLAFLQAGMGALAESIQTALRRMISVASFGAVADGTTDDTAAILAAITAAPAGSTVDLMPGTHKISSTLNITKPITLRGKGLGTDYGPTFTASTKLSWAGGATPMIIFGANGTTSSIFGGGLEGFQLEGNSLASQNLVLKDCQHSRFANLSMTYPVTDALLMENTAGQITGFCQFENVYIQMRGGSPTTSNGVHVNGTSSGADGVTLMLMRNIRIDHSNGHAVLIESIGDAFVWERLFTYRSNADTGVGVWFSSTSTATAICGGHVFIKPVVSAGFLFSGNILNNGTRIINMNLFDLNSGTSAISGPGAADVQFETDLGFAYGRGMVGNSHVVFHSDPMQLVRYDATNGVLQTNAGNWNVTATGGNILDGGVPGGSVILQIGATSGNSAHVYGSTAASGFSVTGNSAYLDFIASLDTTTNVTVLLGFMDGFSPANGMYVKFDPSVSAFYQLVCVAGGVATTVTTNVAPSGKEEFVIYATAGHVVFQHRAVGATSMTLLGEITTNIPTASVTPIYNITTNANSQAALRLYEHKLGFQSEV